MEKRADLAQREQSLRAFLDTILAKKKQAKKTLKVRGDDIKQKQQLQWENYMKMMRDGDAKKFQYTVKIADAEAASKKAQNKLASEEKFFNQKKNQIEQRLK